jgi:hypothetical protein
VIRLLASEIATWRRRREIVVASLAVLVMVAALWISGYLSSQAAAASLPTGPGRAPAELAFLAPYRSPASIAWIVASGIWLFFGVYYLGAATTAATSCGARSGPRSWRAEGGSHSWLGGWRSSWSSAGSSSP